MGIKAVVLSDLHLGEYASILCDQNPANPPSGVDLRLSINNAIDDLTNALFDLASNGGKESPVIHELILLGDALDLTLDESKDFRVSKDNIQSLLEAFTNRRLDIKSIVYIPGNHDYGFWTSAVEEENGGTPYLKCPNKTNYKIVEKNGNWYIDDKDPLNPSKPFQSCFLSYKVKVFYPFYTISLKNHFYMFHHGHLTSPLAVVGKDGNKLEKAEDVEELESMVYPIVNRLWGTKAKEGRPKRFYRQVKEWFYKNIILPSGYIYQPLSTRLTPSLVWTYYKADAQGVDTEELKGNIKKFIELCNVPKLPAFQDKDVTFHYVCGHTHYGGRKKNPFSFATKQGNLYLWNTGGWICPEGMFPPYAFIFYISNNGSPGRCLLLNSKFQTDQKYYNPNILVQHGLVKNRVG
ncbi:MAG TPA: metallophosphoesterase [Candidatus Brocadiales bacterium]|nr:metallophosphoesterase [Candidatus Brocadiales bacterium]